VRAASSGWRRRTQLPGAGLPALPGATVTFGVSHEGHLLGALALSKRPGETLTPLERRLAAQAGLALHNAGLTDELTERMAELRASRKRIVEAADSERRRLERNIHDGAQQQLVALAVLVRLAESVLDSDAGGARELITQAQADASAVTGPAAAVPLRKRRGVPVLASLLAGLSFALAATWLAMAIADRHQLGTANIIFNGDDAIVAVAYPPPGCSSPGAHGPTGSAGS
jgi:Histidine kinase